MTPTHKPEDGDRAPISKKPTPAQRRWLANIATGTTTVAGSYGVWSLRYRAGWPSKSTYVMADSLSDAGWIRISKEDGCREHDKPRVYLTEAGRAALSQPHPHGG